MTYKELQRVLTNAPRRAIQIGGKLHIVIGVPEAGKPDAAEEMIKNALARGLTVRENGVSRWIAIFAIRDVTKVVETERYIWHEDGNRVRAEKFLMTRDAKGKVTREPLGHVWVDYTKI